MTEAELATIILDCEAALEPVAAKHKFRLLRFLAKATQRVVPVPFALVRARQSELAALGLAGAINPEAHALMSRAEELGIPYGINGREFRFRGELHRVLGLREVGGRWMLTAVTGTREVALPMEDVLALLEAQDALAEVERADD